jgi:AhpD family alkylhydroperoxidase
MPIMPVLDDETASPEARAVFDDIRKTRKTDFVNNFWRVLAHDPVLLKRTWESVKEVMAPGALDPLVKEMVYVAISASNNCEYCIRSHTASARAKGMTDAMLMELIAVVGMANETNRLVNGLQVPVDEAFK